MIDDSISELKWLNADFRNMDLPAFPGHIPFGRTGLAASGNNIWFKFFHEYFPDTPGLFSYRGTFPLFWQDPEGRQTDGM